MSLSERVSSRAPSSREPIDQYIGGKQVRSIPLFEGVVFAHTDLETPDYITTPGPERITEWVNTLVVDALIDSKDRPSKALAVAVYEGLIESSRYIKTYLDSTLEQVPIQQELYGVLQGDIAELAVHNLLWWGVAHSDQRDQLRYARFSTTHEDRYQTSLRDHVNGLQNSNFDQVLRSQTRRWKIQTKASQPINPTDAARRVQDYAADITVVYVDQLHPEGAEGIHKAVSLSHHRELAVSWQHLVQVLQTQKTRSKLSTSL